MPEFSSNSYHLQTQAKEGDTKFTVYNGPDYYHALKLAEELEARGNHEITLIETVTITETRRWKRGIGLCFKSLENA